MNKFTKCYNPQFTLGGEEFAE
jgi:hypothetical protein